MSQDERNKVGWEARKEMPAKLRQMIAELKFWQEYEPDKVYAQLVERIISCSESVALTIEHYEKVGTRHS